MSRPIPPVGLFKPNSSKQETKADVTDSAARAIISAEAKARDEKTEKLKALRLKYATTKPAAPARKKAK